jgi:hypothetical protein
LLTCQDCDKSRHHIRVITIVGNWVLAMSVRSVADELAIVGALVLLVIVVVFGAIFALACRNRRGGYSYLSLGATPTSAQRS